MTILEFISKHGEEKTAYKLIDNQVKRVFYLGLSDLPDTCEVSEIVQELADQLTDNPTDKESIKSILMQVDMEFIENIILG